MRQYSPTQFPSLGKAVEETTVMVGMSGGVDSSVAAYLLKSAGYKVQGLFMKNWEEDDGSDYCTAVADLADARSVCKTLDIPLHEANFAAEYWDNVFDHFLEEYKQGRTPNPDILCNREIKFKVFLDYARILGAELIATGHYARLDHSGSSPLLLKGLDKNKDQSYFLQGVRGTQFDRCIFPLGELEKTAVRAIAEEQGLTTYNKKDSTGICFIGERRFKDFLARYIPAQPGPMLDLQGNHLGQHDGLMFYTLGQRQGLGIGGVRHGADAPWYVVYKDLVGNRLYVGQGNDNPALDCTKMTLNDIQWVNEAPSALHRLTVKTRYRQPDQDCHLIFQGNHWEASFADPQRAVTPGQWACFYQDDICLGGGIITSTNQPSFPR